MVLKHIVTSFIFLCATCCPEDDCATVLCEGPPSLGFEVLLNNENVFLNETYTLNDVTITGNNAEDFIFSLETFNTNEPNAILFLQNFDWIPGIFEGNLVLDNDTIISLRVETELSEHGGCCGGIPRLISLQINGIVQEINNGFYTIDLN